MPSDAKSSTDDLPPKDTVPRLLELFRRYSKDIPPFETNFEEDEPFHLLESPVSVATYEAFHASLKYGDELFGWLHDKANYNYYHSRKLLSFVRESNIQRHIASQLTTLIYEKLMAIEVRHPARARKHLTELVWGWAAHCSVSYRRHGGPGHISPSCQWRTPHAGQRLPYVILDICDADSAMSEEIALRAKFVLRRQRGAIGYYVRLEIEPREARSVWITVWRFRGGSRKVVSSRVPRKKILHEDGSVAEGGLAMILHEFFWAGSRGHYRTDEVVALGDAVMKERVFLGYNEIADMVAEAREDMLETR